MPNQLPWLETPIIYDVRAKPRNIASLTGTKDLQMVGALFFLLLFIIYHSSCSLVRLLHTLRRFVQDYSEMERG